MFTRSRIKNPERVLRSGMACLLVFFIFTIVRRYVHPPTLLWEDVLDGSQGLFLGVAIGLIFIAGRLKRKMRARP